MKGSLLGGLIALIQEGSDGVSAVVKNNQLSAGLQSDAAKAYKETLSTQLGKAVKSTFAVNADKLDNTSDKKDLEAAVAGLQSNIAAMMLNATAAYSNITTGAPLSQRSRVATQKSTMGVPEKYFVKAGDIQVHSEGDGADKLTSGLQSFSNLEVDTFVTYSTAYNIASSKQSEFAEAFYKSVLLDPTIASFDLEIKVVQTFTNKKAELGANPYEKGLKSLIKQISDGTSLVKEETRLYPINRVENEPKILKNLAWNQLVAGDMESVAPLKSGEEIGLLSACITTALAAGGVQDSSDSLTADNRITDLFFSVTGKKVVNGTPTDFVDWIKIPLSLNSLTKFVRKINGKATEMSLNEEFVLIFPVKDLKSYVLGTSNGLLDGLADSYSVKFKFYLSGSLDISDGNIMVDPSFKLVEILDADNKNVIESTDVDVAAIKALFTSEKRIAEGYSIKCFRSDENLRQKGQRITQTTYYCSFPLSYHAPRHVDTPAIQFAGSNGDALLETGVNFTGFEMDQLAIKNLLEHMDLIRQVSKADYDDDSLYKIIGPAAYFVTPAQDYRNVDITKIVSNSDSSIFMNSLKSSISYQVREMVIQLAKDSFIGDALKVMAGDETIFVAVGLDNALESFVTPEAIDLPANYKVAVVSTRNTQMRDKIVVTLSKEANSADKANVLDRGWMVWYPDVAAKMQIQEGDATKNTFVYIPGYTHINNMPIGGVIDINGMDLVAKKAGQKVVRIGSTGQIVD